MANLHQLLKAMVEKGASDLHITTGSPPQLRIDGELVPLKTNTLTPVETKNLCYSLLTAAQRGGVRRPDHSVQDSELPGPRPSAGGDRAQQEAARDGAGDGAHRLREE